MSETLESSTYGTPPRSGSKSGFTNARTPIVLLIIAMIGFGALTYPSAANWFASLTQRSDVASYVRQIENIPVQELTDTLRDAEEYNSHVPAGVLRDPYSGSSSDQAGDPGYQQYLSTLTASENGVIGEIRYPRLDISLPIYHGTSDDVLRRGVGHLYGSSLPIGGPSTHSVLTSHSGLLSASLFTDLPKAAVGDVFTVNVMGEDRYYEVRQIETVLPEETQSLRISTGQDRVTLVTCTPIGINSHRLLVHGERIDAPVGSDGKELASSGETAGFPWWALGFISGSALVAFILFKPVNRRKAPNGATEHVFDSKWEGLR